MSFNKLTKRDTLTSVGQGTLGKSILKQDIAGDGVYRRYVRQQLENDREPLAIFEWQIEIEAEERQRIVRKRKLQEYSASATPR